MPTGNAIQTATVVSGGGGSSTSVGSLNTNTATVSIGASNPPTGAGSLLVSTGNTVAVWSATIGSVAYALSAGTVQYAGTATIATSATNSGTATVAGTATIANALTSASGTVNVSNAAAPGGAGSVLTSSDATDAIWSTTSGTVGSAGTAGTVQYAGTATTAAFATNAGTATTAPSMTVSGGTVNTSGATAPGAAGSVLTSSNGAGTGIWSTTIGTVGSAGFATNSGTATLANTSVAPTTGTMAIATSTLISNIGPNATVAAGYVGSGTVLTGYFIGSLNAAAAGTATLYFYWGGTGGVLLASESGYTSADNTSGFNESWFMNWVSASSAQFFTYATGTSTLVTGLNSTTTATTMTCGISWNHNGSGTFTPYFAQMAGYNQGVIGA